MPEFSFLLPLVGILISVVCFLVLRHIAPSENQFVSKSETSSNTVDTKPVSFVLEGARSEIFIVSAATQNKAGLRAMATVPAPGGLQDPEKTAPWLNASLPDASGAQLRVAVHFTDLPAAGISREEVSRPAASPLMRGIQEELHVH